MSDRFYSFPNRTLCDVLSEMRKCDETRNYSYLEDLVEEAINMSLSMLGGLFAEKD